LWIGPCKNKTVEIFAVIIVALKCTRWDVVSRNQFRLTETQNQSAEKIKKDWEEAGAKVQIEITPNVPLNFQAFLATVDIPKDPDQYSLWHSTQTGTNISKYNNPRIDKLLEDGRTELDQETRKKIYIDFQRFLIEDSPAIFLYHPTFYTISRK